ncbi:uncharacterized protein DUF1905 [Kribbella rubisoli]|uniref:Uncharacterized protein DUF1905 n=1 Tax=Kribbella rubisoli TaxID=3075929 RepID=A0A4Q7X775_9ACTN|nr:DUF1905 domain-containing protein [Kribbella rubisoli]RZU18937.1 uncharacterized protein DUF1905 [Kribbella rubisoli]
MSTYRFSAPLWQYPGEGSWYFVAVPEEISDDIADLTAGRRKGFGSVRVSVTVGASTWQTSLFPSKSGSYLLPVKKPVRVAESLTEGTPVETRLDLVDF